MENKENVESVGELEVTGELILSSNYEFLKETLQRNIQEKYAVQVSEENLKSCKTIMANINKDKTAILNRWKAKKQELELPIKEMDSKVKELLNLFDDARTQIGNEVSFYERGRKELASKLAANYYTEKLILKNINSEDEDFPNWDIPNWDNLTFVTAKEELSSLGKKAVDAFISEIEIEMLKKKQFRAEQELEQAKFKETLREEVKQEFLTEIKQVISNNAGEENNEENDGKNVDKVITVVAKFSFVTNYPGKEAVEQFKEKLMGVGLGGMLEEIKIESIKYE